MNYYNENDPKAAAWLRQLIAEHLISDGEVDERSIEEVSPNDLKGFKQCHFFAGIGGWSYALRIAGWPDSREVWTGSCPCQPLSCAGQRKGHADERHLWPAFYALINKRKPSVVFGEQVASKDGREWFAGVRADLEGSGYAVGGADLCAASVGAPHRRQRLYWVAESIERRQRRGNERGSGTLREQMAEQENGTDSANESCYRCEDACGVADAESGICHGWELHRSEQGPCSDRKRTSSESERPGSVVGLADNLQRSGQYGQRAENNRVSELDNTASARCESERQESEIETRDETRLRVSSTGGFWSRFEIVQCRDGKARRFEPESFEVVDGIPTLMGIDGKEGYGKMEKEIEAYADAQEIRPGEAVSLLWRSLVEKTIQSNFGGSVSFSSPPILLAFLRELTNEGWKFSESILRASSETKKKLVRSLWWEKVSPRPSYQRGLEGQRSEESSNALCILSSILARHVQTHWGEAVFAYADTNFPLADPVPGRVALLRGYGNAIVPQVAASFIKAFCEIER